MNIAPISINRIENRTKQNSVKPNFGAFRISHSPEMKTAMQIMKKNCPAFYNNLVANCENILGKTAFFDGLLDIKDGLLVLRLQHKKNFVWPGDGANLVYKNTKDCFISRNTRETEFHPADYDRILRLIKINEDKYKTTYSVKNWSNCDWQWSEKASVEQAKMIKELDDTILDMATEGSVYLGYKKGNAEYFPLSE